MFKLCGKIHLNNVESAISTLSKECLHFFRLCLTYFMFVWFLSSFFFSSSSSSFLRQVFSGSPGCCGTCSVDQARLELRDPPTSLLP